jgi:hypothetical protein
MDRVSEAIDAVLAKPMQPTDGFGTPVGEPTTLQGMIVHQVATWSTQLVDSEGRVGKNDNYGSPKFHPRIDWALGKIVHGDLKKQVDAEVVKIVGTLRESATALIAKQVAEKISGLVIK